LTFGGIALDPVEAVGTDEGEELELEEGAA
jgi:hypothetical protein